MLRDSIVVVVVVVRTRPRAIPLAMITIRKSTHGFPFVFHIWIAYGAPLDGTSGRRSSAITLCISWGELICNVFMGWFTGALTSVLQYV